MATVKIVLCYKCRVRNIKVSYNTEGYNVLLCVDCLLEELKKEFEGGDKRL